MVYPEPRSIRADAEIVLDRGGAWTYGRGGAWSNLATERHQAMRRAKAAKIRFKDLAGRLTGVSCPIFGLQWSPPESDRKIVREVFVFLEDRRALFNYYAHEIDHQVAESVLQIRAELTAALKRISEDSEAVAHLKAMRAACREYLSSTQGHHLGWGGPFSFMTQLGRFRTIVGTHLAYLGVKYGIDIEGELVRGVPPEYQDPKFLDE